MREFTLTPEQLERVEYDGSPHSLITGAPGSGKTIVLLERARRFAQAPDVARGSVVVFTYNKTLANYARSLIAQNMDVPTVEVTNFHRWAWRKLAPVGRRVLDERERLNMLTLIVAGVRVGQEQRSAVLEREPGWWSDEVRWIKGRAILDWPDYAAVERAGRGSGLAEPARRVVWAVFEAYQGELRRSGRLDWEDFALELLARYNPVPDCELIDHVFIDEAQDLHHAELLLLRGLARKSLTIVADRGQKIYKTTPVWSKLGIEIQGYDARGRLKSRTLKTIFRSTRQIALLAANVRERDTSLTLEEMEHELPAREGPLPVLYSAPSAAREEEVVMSWVRTTLRQHPAWTVALLARHWHTLEALHRRMAAAGVRAEVIRDAEGHPTSPGVKLTTFHSSKGLEFDAVVLMRLNEGVIPEAFPETAQPDAMDSAANVDDGEPDAFADFLSDERRLLYVPMTRARHELYLTHSQPPSRFLSELDPHLYRQLP